MARRGPDNRSVQTPKHVYDDGDYKMPMHYTRTNPLLVRPVVGQVKPTTYKLPGEDYVYGKVDGGDAEGAREVVNSWRQHTPSTAKRPNRNFVRLNKGAAQNGMVTAKHITTYRQTNDIRLRAGPPPKKRDAVVPNNYTTYGRPSSYTTGVGHLIANVYQRQAIEKARGRAAKDEKAANIKKKKSVIRTNAMHTRASLGHHKVLLDDSKELFKMKQFQDVPSRVQQRLGLAHTQQTAYFGASPGRPVSAGAVMTASSSAARLHGLNASASQHFPRAPAAAAAGGGAGGLPPQAFAAAAANGAYYGGASEPNSAHAPAHGGAAAAGGLTDHTTFLDNGVRVSAHT